MAECLKWKPVIVILAVYFVLALLNILFKKVLDDGQSQLVIVSYRLIVGAIFLMPIAFFCERKSDSKLTMPILSHLFFSALMGATLTQYLLLMGIQYTSAAYSTAFTNIAPIFTFLLALLLRQENVNLRRKSGIAKVSGSLICIGGVVVLIFYRGFPLNHSGMSTSYHHAHNSKLDGRRNWTVGSLFLVLSILCWSGWFLIQARIGQMYPCKYTSTTVMSALGAVQSTFLCFAINRDTSVWILTGKLEIITVLFAGIFGSGLCYVGISWCVEQKGPVFTAAFSPVIQIFVVILDFTIFHEQVYIGSVYGSVLVVCGLYILLWGKNSDKVAVVNISKPAEVAECNGNSAPLTTVI
ncbi:WAT1-related protein At3g30340-like [Silene latifolia]|uniref:WAT1-related protein At3g30340-like n=1 Tax=Silene latifolia TaxID=37657 RepID=UPI003D77A616